MVGDKMIKNKKRILVISQYFYPEPFRINDMCKEWVERGYEVTVVTGIPNYPQGEFYEGYDREHNRNEVWNGVNIIRIPLAPRKSGSLNMIKNYLSFVWSGFWWQRKTDIKADFVFNFEVSPMTQALIGVWYAKKYKIPCYLYVQDLWPENVEIVTGIHTSLVLAPIGCMVNYIYKNCTRIFGTSPSFVTEIQKRCKEKDKVSFWPQYAEEFYCKSDKKKAFDFVTELKDDNRFKLIFTGNIGQAQGLEILPKTAKILKEKKSDFLFVIVGDGRNKQEFLRQIEENKVTDMFVIIERKPAERIPYSYHVVRLLLYRLWRNRFLQKRFLLNCNLTWRVACQLLLRHLEKRRGLLRKHSVVYALRLAIKNDWLRH